MRCYGPQGDPSVFDTDRDGDADTLVLSVDSVLSGPKCGAGPASKNVSDGQGGFRYPAGAWEGLRVFDISNPTAPEQIAAVYQDCGSHTNTLLPAPRGKLDVRAELELPARRRPDLRPAGREQGREVNHGVVQVIEVPFNDPAARASSPSSRSSTRVTRTASTSRSRDHGIAAPPSTTSSAATT